MKKAQKVHKKTLRISLEKIRNLGDSDLTGVAGGDTSVVVCTHTSGNPCPQ